MLLELRTRIGTWLDISKTVSTQILLQSILHENISFSYSTPVKTILGVSFQPCSLWQPIYHPPQLELKKGAGTHVSRFKICTLSTFSLIPHSQNWLFSLTPSLTLPTIHRSVIPGFRHLQNKYRKH